LLEVQVAGTDLGVELSFVEVGNPSRIMIVVADPVHGGLSLAQ
jgi:hypothetical protein